MIRPRLLLAAALVLAAAAPGRAVEPAGPEIPVNAYRPAAQRDPDVAMLPGGGFVVVWESQGQDGTGNDVFGQRFAASGAKLGGEFQVSQSVTFDFLLTPRVASAPDGSFAVVWHAEDEGIGQLKVYGRWYAPSGAPATGPLTLTTAPDRAYGYPSIDADASGRYVVVFTNFVDTGIIEGRRFSSAGAPLGPIFRANPGSTGGAGYPDVAATPSGSFVVAWHEFPDNGTFQVLARRFDANQAPLGTNVPVSTDPLLAATTPRVDVAPDGRFVVVWNQQETPSFGGDAVGRRFAASGAPLGAPFQLATATAGDQTNPDVGVDADGGFVAVWQAFGPGDELVDVLGQRFAASGARVGAEFVASQEPGVQQDEPAVAVDGTGAFAAAWHVVHEDTGFDVAARRFLAESAGAGGAAAVDFGGNGDTDVAVFRPSQGRWLADFDFQPGAEMNVVYGRSGDVPLPKDWDGDGTTDLAVFRPASGTWFLDFGRNGGTNAQVVYGRSGDVPVPADYDGDGATDLAVWRASSSTWFVDTNRNGGTDVRVVLGGAGAIPVPGDYDGDGAADVAVFASGRWRIDLGADGAVDVDLLYGQAGDLPIPADYDGDGVTDLAVFRPASARWFVDTNRNGGSDLILFYGVPGDVPVPGDFDGDGRFDLAVYRPATGRWFVDVNQNGGSDFAVTFGGAGDVPLRENGWILDTLGLTD